MRHDPDRADWSPRPTRLTRQNVWVVGLAVGLFLMIVGNYVALPDSDVNRNAWAPAFNVTGELNQPVKLRTGTVQVSNLRLAHSLVDGSLGVVRTPGIWVLLDVSYTGSTQADLLVATFVTEDGVEYDGTGRLPSLGVSYLINGDPEIPVTGTLAFEVPKEALADASVTLGAEFGSTALGDAVWDTKAVLSLGLDEERAAALQRTAPPILPVPDN